MQPMSRRIVKKSGTGTSIGTGTDIVIQVGEDKGSAASAADVVKVCIRRVKLKNTAGATIASFQPAIFSAASATLGDISTEYQGIGCVKADLYDDSMLEYFCYTDTRGRLYLRPTPDAGADNTFSYALYLEITF